MDNLNIQNLPQAGFGSIEVLHVMGALHGGVIGHNTTAGGAKGFDGVHFILLHLCSFSALHYRHRLAGVDFWVRKRYYN